MIFFDYFLMSHILASIVWTKTEMQGRNQKIIFCVSMLFELFPLYGISFFTVVLRLAQ